MRPNAEQLALQRQKLGVYDLALDVLAWLLDENKQRVQKVGVPRSNRLHVLRDGEEPPEGSDTLEALRVVVKDTRAKGGRRILPEGTRFWVEVR